MSEKVTRELLKIKDALAVVIEKCETTEEFTIKRIGDKSDYEQKN